MTGTHQFARVLIDDNIPASLAAGEWIALEPGFFDHRGRLRVDILIRNLVMKNLVCPTSGAMPLLVLTGHDLSLPGCSALFGYADHDRQIAVVSTFRLWDPNREVLTQRLENEIAHEWAHLEGWLHCGTEGCLMHAVTDAAELDSRPTARCGTCPRMHTWPRWRRLAAACLFFAATIAAGDSIPALVSLPEFQAPFS